jgi:hypothetical protein
LKGCFPSIKLIQGIDDLIYTTDRPIKIPYSSKHSDIPRYKIGKMVSLTDVSGMERIYVREIYRNLELFTKVPITYFDGFVPCGLNMEEENLDSDFIDMI